MKILIKNDSEIKKLSEQNYKQENQIQKLIYDNPDIIPIEEIEDGIKTIKVVREFGIPNSGSTDLIGIDNNANIYIIECKLAYNPQIKREVIGQILEYASFLWRMPFDDFQNRFCKKEGGTIIGKFKDLPEDESIKNSFISKIKDNLANGNFKLIVIVDKLNDLLKGTLEFINFSNRENLELIGLEVVYFKDGKLEIFAPNIFGINYKKHTERISWNEQKFLEAISPLNDSQITILNDLVIFVKDYAFIYKWGTGKSEGSLTYRMNYANDEVTLFSIYTNGKLTISFGEVENKMGIENFKKFINSLKKLDYFKDLKEETYSGGKYPYFNLENLFKNIKNLEIFKNIIIEFSQG